MPLLLLRIDLLAIEEDPEGAGRSRADTSGDAKLAFDIVLEAHGLALDVSSKEAAFDFDGHLCSATLIGRLADVEWIWGNSRR